jgi:hypothetical protein
MRKPKYNVGDYVRIKSDLKVNLDEGLVPEMVKMAGKLVQIAYVDSFDIDEDDMPYVIKELESYFWSEDWFEYRLGNYEDNKIENLRFKYEIGYHRYDDRLEIFEGFIENFYPSGKSAFVDENGKLLVVPYERIEFIVPKESNND